MENSAYKKPVKFETFSQFVYFMFVLDLSEALEVIKNVKIFKIIRKLGQGTSKKIISRDSAEQNFWEKLIYIWNTKPRRVKLVPKDRKLLNYYAQY